MSEKSCRTCLASNSDVSFNIFTSVCKKRKVLLCDMFLACTKIKPQCDDGHPKNICKECNKQLKRAYSFSLLCSDSEKQLQKLLESNTEVEKTKLEIKTEECLPIIAIEVKREDNVKTEPEVYNDLEDDDNCWVEDDDMLLGLLKDAKSNEIKNEIEEYSAPLEGNIEIEKISRKRNKKEKQGKLAHQCDVCGKLLSSKGNLKAHKICHTEQRPFSCTECPATFRGYSALFQHRKVHSGSTPYHCEFCPSQFSRRTSLVNHIRIHTGEKLYNCEVCHKSFIQKAQLSIHMKRHKGEKTYLCQDCGKGFPIRSDLKIHQRIHNGEKPYSCTMCSKTFATSGNLSIHIRVHKKEIRYNCEECSRGFVTHSSYSVHMKRHKGQKDYRCECGKSFYTSSSLKSHRVVHTGEKRYQCKICERKFTQTSHLTRHFRKDHGKPNGQNIPSEQYRLTLRQPITIIEYTDNIHGLKNTNGDRVKCEAS